MIQRADSGKNINLNIIEASELAEYIKDVVPNYPFGRADGSTRKETRQIARAVLKVAIDHLKEEAEALKFIDMIHMGGKKA